MLQGAYSEHITNSKNLTIIGAGAGSTYITGASPALAVTAGTTTISGMTFINAVDTQPVIRRKTTPAVLNMTASRSSGSFYKIKP